MTAVSFALAPVERSSCAAFVAFASYDAALAGLLAFERAFGEMLSAFEFMSAAAVGCVANAYPASRIPFEADAAACYALVEIATGMQLDALLEERTIATLDALAGEHVVLDAACAPAERFWRIRDALPAAVAQDGIPLSFDVSFPRGALAAFVDEAEQWIAAAHRRCAATRSGISATAAAISSCRSRTPVRTASHCSRWRCAARCTNASCEPAAASAPSMASGRSTSRTTASMCRPHNGGSPPPSSTPSTRWV